MAVTIPFSIRIFAVTITATFLVFFATRMLPDTTSFSGVDLSAYNLSWPDTKPHNRIEPYSRDIRNRTLGFQKIFSIGFANRGDRRDTLTIASSLTDVDITRADAVAYADMATKGVTEGWKTPERINSSLIESLIGSQRAHFNVLDHIIENDISTALILEDDSDWDYHIKDQLVAIAEAFRGLQEFGSMSKRTNGSPYGDSWDVLWLGHCRVGPRETDEPIYVLSNDPTVPPMLERHSQWKSQHVPDILLQNDTRIAFKAHRATCTFAYAVSRSGAQKIVTALSLGQNAQPFDSAMNDLARGALKPKLETFSIYPPVISSHRFQGSSAKDSDISALSEAAQDRHKEYSWDVVFSVLQNAVRLLSGAKTVTSQWPDLTTVTERSVYEPLDIHVAPLQVNWKQLPVILNHQLQTARTWSYKLKES